MMFRFVGILSCEVEIAAPPRRIVALAVIFERGPIQNHLDAAPNADRCIRACLPELSRRVNLASVRGDHGGHGLFQHVHDITAGNTADRQVAKDWVDVGFERAFTLRRMLFVFLAALAGSDALLCGFLKSLVKGSLKAGLCVFPLAGREGLSLLRAHGNAVVPRSARSRAIAPGRGRAPCGVPDHPPCSERSSFRLPGRSRETRSVAIAIFARGEFPSNRRMHELTHRGPLPFCYRAVAGLSRTFLNAAAPNAQETLQNRNFMRRCRTHRNATELAGGGWGEIRTHGTLAGPAVFKTAALNHSATHPQTAALNREERFAKQTRRSCGPLGATNARSVSEGPRPPIRIGFLSFCRSLQQPALSLAPPAVSLPTHPGPDSMRFAADPLLSPLWP